MADLIANHVGINRSYLHTLFSKCETAPSLTILTILGLKERPFY